MKETILEQKALRCVVMNRWTDEFSAYERYIDHTLHQVAYIATAEGATVLGNKAAVHVEIVPDFKDEAVLLAALDSCKRALGGIDHLICLSEFDLTMAAQLRERHGIAGDKPHEVARFRDKTVMKQQVLAADLRAPRFIALDSEPATLAVLHTLRFPLILKPRSGAASIGVHKITNKTELEYWLARVPLEEYECEEFIEGPIFHVDGLVTNGSICFQKASRYIGTCLEFAQGKALSSIVMATSELQQRLLQFSTDCLHALGLKQGAFHIEIIHGSDGFYFLEVGARVGGGEIPFTMKEVFGVDMFEAWVQQQLNPAYVLKEKAGGQELSGFLMIPEPIGTRLLAATVPHNIKSLYASLIAPIHHVFDGNGGYDMILGRFRYRAESEMQIENDIRQTLQQFSYQLENVVNTNANGAETETCH